MSRGHPDQTPRSHDRRPSGFINVPCRIPTTSRPWEMTTKLEHRDFLIDQCGNRRHSSPIPVQLPMISNMIMGNSVSSTPDCTSPTTPHDLSSPSMSPFSSKENRLPADPHQQPRRQPQAYGAPSYQEPVVHHSHRRQYSQTQSPAFYNRPPPHGYIYDGTPTGTPQQPPYPSGYSGTHTPLRYPDGAPSNSVSPRPYYPSSPPAPAAGGWYESDQHPGNPGAVRPVRNDYMHDPPQPGFISGSASSKASGSVSHPASANGHRAFVYTLVEMPNGGKQYQVRN
ncbi:hypothetical protein BROUX41_004906 [Berkeleyomyces rouxiae]|uniref:uncharacterized protein n=1 Tax=Berkeleyomyces rouxiae TaxID=2035830 RepID=UPI003B8060B7